MKHYLLGFLLLSAAACYRPLEYAYEGDMGHADLRRPPSDLTTPTDLSSLPPCSSYKDAASCQKIPEQGCQVYDCCGFKSCHATGEELPVCFADCLPNCDSYTEPDCKATSACHPVYEGCYPNESCVKEPLFKSCALGETKCDWSEALCDALPPSCPDGFVPGIANGCYEGCVPRSDCCTPRCDAGQYCDVCWTGYSCIPEGAVC